MTNPRVAAVIPCYNAESFIAATIESLLAQTLPADEIVVVDDGSRDATPEIARQYPARVVQHPTNRGLAAARNSGILAASGEIIVFLDADALADEDLIKNLLPYYSDSRVGGVGGRVVEANIRSPFDRYRQLLLTQYHPADFHPSAPWISGCCSSYRKAALVAVGGFDPFYKTNAEDNDIGARLNAAGYRIVYTSSATARHLKTDTWASLNSTAFRYCYWAARFIHRNQVRPHMAYHRILGGGVWKSVLLATNWRRPDLLPVHATVVWNKLWGFYRGNRDAMRAGDGGRGLVKKDYLQEFAY